MTAAELADMNIELYQLMTVLVDSVGVSLLTIAVFFLVLGRLAVQHRSSFLAVFLMLFLFTFPLTYLVHSAEAQSNSPGSEQYSISGRSP